MSRTGGQHVAKKRQRRRATSTAISEGVAATHTEIVSPREGFVPEHLSEEVQSNLEAARATNTRKAYNGDINQFGAWCMKEGLQSLPAAPATIAAYITALALLGRRPSTIKRALAAISQAHKLAGHIPAPTASPKVHEVLKGICNREGVAQLQAHPFTPNDVRQHGALIQAGLRWLRDHAMLTMGAAGAFRRSELVALDVEDLTEHQGQGIVALVRRSKTDQAGVGRDVELAFGDHPESCPVRALRAWLEAACISSGPVFCEITVNGKLTANRASMQSVSRCAKRVAKRLGYKAENFSGHSFRATYVTAAKRAGKSNAQIMRQTGHRSSAMVDRYDRQANVFVDSPSKGIGL